MSNNFGGFGSTTFAVHQDFSENASNQALKKSKRDEVQGKAPAIKRAALGSLTNTTRNQPIRTVKQGTTDPFVTYANDENVHTKAPKSKSVFGVQQAQPFTIHCDGETAPQKPQIATEVETENRLSSQKLHPSLTTLSRPPLSVLENRPTIDLTQSDSDSCSEFEVEDSPMLLDSSSMVVASEQTEETIRFSRILRCPDYADEIYEYLRELELKFRPKPGYMRKQPDITNSMRNILVDWLVEVGEEYQLHRETLCLSIQYVDLFLSEMSVLRGKLQLVGAAAMFLAAKYEEIYPPELKEFVYITDDTYTKKQVLRMEHLILKVLSFNLALPTVNIFTERFLEMLDADEKNPVHSLAMYLMELSLVDADPFLKYTPSVTAAAAVCLACSTLNHEAWSSHMQTKTGYQVSDFDACLRDLYSAFCRAPSHPQQAVREKYKQSQYHRVSMLSPPPVCPVTSSSTEESSSSSETAMQS